MRGGGKLRIPDSWDRRVAEGKGGTKRTEDPDVTINRPQLGGRMDRPSESKEKRRYPRVLINLPVNLWMIRELKAAPGFVLDASEGGLLIQTFTDMPLGTRIAIKIFFKVLLSRGVTPAKIRAVADIIWKDTYWWEDWEGYQYGLKFIQILEEDCRKLKLILNNRSNLEEVSIADH